MEENKEKYNIELNFKEIILLYIFLKKQQNLDPLRLIKIQRNLESIIYNICSIEEMENIEKYYERL